MSWSLVAGQVANSTTSPVAYPGNCTAGNLLVLVMRSGVNGAGQTTVSDTLTNSWTQAILETITGGSQAFQLWYVLKCKSTGANSITIGGSNGTANAVCAEFSPSGAIASVDGTPSSATGDSTAAASGNITPANGNDLIVAGCFNTTANGRTITSSNLTIPTNGTSNGNGSLGYALNQPAGTYDPAFVYSSTAVDWGAGAAAFSIPGSTGGGNSSWLTVDANNSLRGLRH
jgi:hypothetical protein